MSRILRRRICRSRAQSATRRQQCGFPASDGPSKATNSPGFTLKLTSSKRGGPATTRCRRHGLRRRHSSEAPNVAGKWGSANREALHLTTPFCQTSKPVAGPEQQRDRPRAQQRHHDQRGITCSNRPPNLGPLQIPARPALTPIISATTARAKDDPRPIEQARPKTCGSAAENGDLETRNDGLAPPAFGRYVVFRRC